MTIRGWATVYVLQWHAEILGVFSNSEMAFEFAKRRGVDDRDRWERHDSHGVHWINGNYTIQQTELFT